MLIFRYFLLSFFLITAGCASSDKINADTAEGAFKLAQQYEKDERYEEAITYYSEVKNKHPYHSLAIESELKIADIEFSRENFAEAETAYKLFKDFHPQHGKIAYVTFRLGEAVMNQLPATFDRDLSLASKAIEYFDGVINNYPQSEYFKAATDQKRKALQMLADKESYVAEYYYVRELWLSALGRYEDLMHSHPGFGYDAQALYGATLSAYNLKDMDKAKTYFKKLLADYPKSKEVAKARRELADGF